MRFVQSLKTFLLALVMVGLTFGLLEVSLRVVDPWGLKYFDDVTKMGEIMFAPDAQRGYRLKDGTHTYSHWQVHVEDGVRVTPDTNTAADCTVAFLGDSVTFGAGVNDDQTWVNQLAKALPDIQLRNYGVPRYNITNSLGTRRALPDHQAYIYTMFNNDSEPAYDPEASALVEGLNMPWMIHYLQLAMKRTAPPAPIDEARFFGDLDALLAEGRVSLVAFEDDVLTDMVIERGYTVHTVPFPPKPVSVADFHLNPEGNADLAASLTPFVSGLAAEACA
jgi:hypothetical protein